MLLSEQGGKHDIWRPYQNSHFIEMDFAKAPRKGAGMSGDHNRYQKPKYVDCRQWKYDPMTGEPLIDGWPLYSGLPKREWRGLTDEEIKNLLWESRVDNLTFARVIEKVLREKNAA